MMPHPLEKKIVVLRRRARRAALAYGLSATAATLLAAVVLLGSADYWFRFQDRGLRVLLSLTAICALAEALRRYALPSLRMSLGDVDLASRVQRRFPELGDRLVTAVEFLRTAPDDPAAGSPSLRRAVVAQVTAETAPLDFGRVLDRRPARSAAMALAVAALAACIFAAMDPSASRVAMARLADPLGDAAWPRATNLLLRESVERVARGGAFQVEAIDAHGARLPSDVWIDYRFVGPDGAAVEETEPMRIADGLAVARRENVLRPFAYRIEGGDDRAAPWRDVRVVEPPAVESASVRLIPPAYSGWPPGASTRRIRALVGTTVRIAGRATEPLRSAEVRFDDGTRIPARTADGGRDFTVEFRVEKSGSYWFVLTDREGLAAGDDDRWEIHAIADTKPTGTLERPAANVFVTPRAVVPLRVAVRDDLAVAEISLAFRQSDGPSQGATTIWKASDGPRSGHDDSRVVDARWDLAPLGLKPGMQLTFWAEAADFLPQTGKSEPRSLAVITPEELQDRIGDREKLVAAELDRALKLEQNCRAQVESLLASLAKTAAVGQAEVDRLQAVGNGQADVEQLLSNRGEGVPTHLHALLDDLENNGVGEEDVRRRAAALLAEVERIAREHLPAIRRELTDAAKTAQSDAGPRVAASLAAAAERQDAVIAALAELSGRQTRWDNYRRFAHEMGQLAREHNEVSRSTADVGRQTMARALSDLTPQQVADLKAPAERQLDLARRLDRILQEMDQTGDELRRHDPSAAGAVAEAVDQARRFAVGGRMREAGRQILQNQIGRAVAGQKTVQRDLDAVLATLDARRTRPSGDSSVGRSQAGNSAKQAKTPQTTADGAPTRESAAQGKSPTDKSAGPGTPAESQPKRPDAEQLRAVIKRHWGQLPARARQQMLQSPVERFSPKYDALTEQYFRRLSESKGNDEP